eukprot:c24404_g1_i1 orf=734-2785(-)
MKLPEELLLRSSLLTRLLALLSLSCLCFYIGKRWAFKYEEVVVLGKELGSLGDSPSAYLVLVDESERQQSAGEGIVHSENISNLGVPPDAALQNTSFAVVPATVPVPSHPSPFVGMLKEDGSIEQDFAGDGEEDLQGIEIDSDLEVPNVTESSDAFNMSIETYKFEVCPRSMKEYIPCLDNVAAIKRLPSTKKGENWERHCPDRKEDQFGCLIAAPRGYRYPIRWPRSKDQVWYSNVPHTRLVQDKGGQNWIAIKKDKFIFPGGGTQFAHGATQYLDQMVKMVPKIAFGVYTRVALDIGCGVASWGAYLLSRDVLPLSIAPKDVHENQIQFALERGIPAMVAALATHRLLYPSQAFDLIHCSRCRIEWTHDGGILLLEVDRILRAGGYFAWAAQPVYKHEGNLPEEWNAMVDLAGRLCWELVAKEGYIAIWQKPINNECYYKRDPGTQPPLCDRSEDPNAIWYAPLKACITLLPEGVVGRNVSDWPARLHATPYRLYSVQTDAKAAKEEVFIAEQRYWHEIVSGFLRGLGLKRETVRNVMDMKAGYGGFAAALVDHKVDWWVMNVVPISGINTLPVIYDRGLIGVAHDWCEAFDTYPRTYDLLHAVGLFTLEEKRCNIAHIFVEMDRILRPGGWVLIREPSDMILKLDALARSVRWSTRILDDENGPFGKNKLLACRKQLWRG